MDHRRTENFYIIVSPGLEETCAAELSAIGIPPRQIDKGGIACTGRLRELYLANLWLRTASRVLVRFAACRSRDFPDLYRKARQLPWGRFIHAETPVAFRVACHGSRLNHSTRVAETLESALNRALGRSTNPTGKDPQLVMVRIVEDVVTISIDTSGELLHRRGYRKTVTAAPLRETLAAGILMLLDWQGHEALVDPMCGSGTFVIEAAERAEEAEIRAAWKKDPENKGDGSTQTAGGNEAAVQKIRLVSRRVAQRRESTDFEIPFFDDEDHGQHERSYF